MDLRLEQLERWLGETLRLKYSSIAPASSDASFRRYFRIIVDGDSFVVMDAPPEKENCAPFIKVSNTMLDFGLNVPRVLKRDLENGFLLLTDLGSEQYLPHLNEQSVDALYSDAINALVNLQAQGDEESDELPLYNHTRLMSELELFREWFIGQHLGIDLDATQEKLIDDTFEWLITSALEQPQVWVHRDFHSRNLMVCNENSPGILDFQDAVVGAASYDLVSLLKDCYIVWPRERVEYWVTEYRAKALRAGISGIEDPEKLLHWFDAMGVQRHIKVLGIFCRLNIRDGKSVYMDDIPRVFDYVMDACERLPQLLEFKRFLEKVVVPRMA
ncbi:aminoglycoside phosphotransferase family protein [Pseudomonadota bacterium]